MFSRSSEDKALANTSVQSLASYYHNCFFFLNSVMCIFNTTFFLFICFVEIHLDIVFEKRECIITTLQ